MVTGDTSPIAMRDVSAASITGICFATIFSRSARYSGVSFSIVVNMTRRTWKRSSTERSPVMWSACGCVAITRSIVRLKIPRRRESFATIVASGPPSISTRSPDRVVMSIASPCPISKISREKYSPRKREKRRTKRRKTPAPLMKTARCFRMNNFVPMGSYATTNKKVRRTNPRT